ncbi:type VII secretion integral membrane protein EccD [Mycobacterium sp. 21AC1]|uniref:type VII secretion integral membrane protein EccD n=1 Tax=[Mycobacterium] appelbergii TaxID=2939269 RepID=UPI002939057C|nr:type VII secretion integral membrane protein EccD [Mycobacterium sp. 21AC1]MDV3124008.1 type VII secretion integral membrane protein EccD [Mycobacterium sp. 21AC1]
MTGIGELRELRVVSAAPQAIRVSVVGGRTQLDVALPADVPVAAFLAELARLIRSRDTGRGGDTLDRDDRRTFWILSRADRAGTGPAVLDPDRTLREAGVENGELLRLSAHRALSPPTLYDDVVDAAARLNRAAYAAWDAASARMMAFAGLWLCTAVWVLLLLAPEMSGHRPMVVAGAALTTVGLGAGAALVCRLLGRTDIASATAAPVITLSATVGWVLAAHYGDIGLAAACAVVLALIAAYYRVIRAGHWAYVCISVPLVFALLVFAGRAVGVRVDVLATAAAAVAVLGCLAVPVLTARWGQIPVPTQPSDAARRQDPFTAAEIEPPTPMPSAEEVWARVRSAVLTRSGLLAGLAGVVLVGATMLMRVDPDWAAFAFALVCAAVLALRSRRPATWPERVALAVPALALVLITCVQAQSGSRPLQFAALGVVGALAVAGAVVGVAATGSRRFTLARSAAVHLEYVAVAAVIPLALWPFGIYERLGLS